MKRTEDIVVIGGGVIGVCVAYYLLKEGRKVILLERDEVCSGSSYGNTGLIVPSHSIPLPTPGVVMRALKWMFDSESPFYVKPRLDPRLISWLWQFRAASKRSRMLKSVQVLLELSGVSHKYDDVYILALRRSGLHTPLERGRAWQAEAHTPSSCLRRSGSSSKRWPPSIRHRIETSFAPRSSCTPSKALPTNRSPLGWTCHARSSPSGESGSTNNGWPVWPSDPAPDAPRSFPPRVVVEVKAIACELPATLGVPLSRLHVPDIRTAVVARGLVAQISDTTIWRWLSEDAIKPWQHRSWIFPRDPDFEQKAGVVLDLYHRTFQGRPLGPNEFVLSADEKTSIQARCRCHPTLPPAKARTMRVEHEYERGGALQYLAAWDCHHAKLFGRCEPKTGVSPFGRLVAQVMNTHPYRSAKRVFWIVDNGSSHRGQRSINRLQGQYPNLRLVHLPLHASWLNQVEIFFSILQRKVLTPNDFTELADVEHRVLAFQRRYQQTAAPFQWQFTRDDLADLMKKLHKAQQLQEQLAA